jgi:hypothetical protein
MAETAAAVSGLADPHFQSPASVSLNSFRGITVAKTCKLDDVDRAS